MTDLDLSRAPLGLVVATELIDAVVDLGDLAERHYLELKSTLDLSSKRDQEKLAKFILGAANRMPGHAATAFEGYAVMLIGVGNGSAPGIEPIEMLGLVNGVRRFLGATGPRWDVVWSPVEAAGKAVLVLVVDPPKNGQGPFPCRANGESLVDGRIYVRAEGATREATAEEVDMLVQRGRTASDATVEIGIELLGDLVSYEVDEESTIDRYISNVRRSLLSALPKEPTKSSPNLEYSTALSDMTAKISAEFVRGSFLNSTTPESRSPDQYRDQIDDWEEEVRGSWADAREVLIGHLGRPCIFRITNQTSNFLNGVEVVLHLDGAIRGVPHQNEDRVANVRTLGIPDPPRRWGPRQRDLGLASLFRPTSFPAGMFGRPIAPSVRYRNSGSVTLEFHVGDLRPMGVYQSEDEVLVLVVDDLAVGAVHGGWELTAVGHNQVYRGEVAFSVGPCRQVTQAACRALGLIS